MTSTDMPLTLWRGSHQAGSGKGCAMNVVSWENGDTTITDFPDCSDWLLARIVQIVNDRLAGRDGRLAPVDAFEALRLGHATVGTSAHGLSDVELQRVYVQCALHLARGRYIQDPEGLGLLAIRATEQWVIGPTPFDSGHLYWASQQAEMVSPLAAAVAEAASEHTIDLARADVTHAFELATTRKTQVQLAGEVIDLFKQLTGTGSTTPEPVVVERALRDMASTHAG